MVGPHEFGVYIFSFCAFLGFVLVETFIYLCIYLFICLLVC